VEHSHKSPFRFLAVRHYQIAGQRDWQPALNMYETDDALYIVVELAGIDPNVLLIDVETNLIRIEGIRQPEPPDGLCRIHRMEIAAGPFQIETALPVPVDPDQAHSQYKNGLLEIVLPLVKQAPRRVAISSTEGEKV
jgi:HSP20 family molecular chaperone IbpA